VGDGYGGVHHTGHTGVGTGTNGMTSGLGTGATTGVATGAGLGAGTGVTGVRCASISTFPADTALGPHRSRTPRRR
jgi:hypothetical protein